MKEQELEQLLGDGRPDFELGPIEDQLHALATERQMPDLAVGLCTIRIEESAPALRAVLARAADAETLSEEDATLLFRGLHILGGARDSLACQPLRQRRQIQEMLSDKPATVSATPSGHLQTDIPA